MGTMTNTAEQENDGLGPFYAVAIIVFLAVVLLGAGLWFALPDWATRGQFGDMYGVLNTTFSGLAFSALVFTLVLQRKELRLQRQELALTRAELEKQSAAQTEHARTALRQSFENTFFQLVRLHNDIVNAIDLVKAGEGTRVTKGRDCFQVFYKRLAEEYEPEARGNTHPAKATIHMLNDVYMRFYAKHEAELGHYFRSLYNAVKLVHQSNVPDKRLYTNLVRAQLSSNELLIVFYNCLSEMGREKFKPLAIEYALFKHLPINNLLNRTHASLLQ
jgi:hypothetical protein